MSTIYTKNMISYFLWAGLFIYIFNTQRLIDWTELNMTQNLLNIVRIENKQQKFAFTPDV